MNLHRSQQCLHTLQVHCHPHQRWGRWARLVFVLIFLGALSSSLHTSGAESPLTPEVVLIRSDEQGVALELRIPDPVVDVVHTQHGRRTRVELPEFGRLRVFGRPDLPQKTVLVAIPPGVRVTLDVLEEDVSSVALSAPVLPSPIPVLDAQFHEGDNLAVDTPLRYKEHLKWSRPPVPLDVVRKRYPQSSAHLGEIGYIRNQRYARVVFTPVQVEPRGRSLRVVHKVKVVLHFSGAIGPTVHADPRDAFENVLRVALINYAQSQHWRTPITPSTESRPALSYLSDTPQYKIHINRDGFVLVRGAELKAAGFPVNHVQSRYLHVREREQEIAIWVNDGGDGHFDEEDTLVFYGRKTRTRYTDENIYWLWVDNTPGLRIETVSSPPDPSVPSVEVFSSTVHMEENHIYLSDVPRVEGADHWYWMYYSAGRPTSRSRREVSFALPGLVAEGTAILTPVVQGVSSHFAVNPDHHVRFFVNGSRIGDAFWDGIRAWDTPFTFDASTLRPLGNVFRLEDVLDTGAPEDVGYLNWFEVTYPRAFRAYEDVLAFSLGRTHAVRVAITGFHNTPIWLFDVTDPLHPRRLVGEESQADDGTYSLSVTLPLDGIRSFWAGTLNGMVRPTRIEADTPSAWRTPEHQADYIIIAHDITMAAAQRLAEHRRAQGYTVAVVNVQDIYDEFNGGVLSAEAIRDFLAYAYEHWQRPAPAFVLLFGDGTYDFKNYEGTNTPTVIPPLLRLVDPFLGETASDNRYVTISGDDPIPDMHIGRLPANTSAEAEQMVDKIITYETNPPAGDWSGRIVFVADNADQAGDFAALANQVADHLVPSSYEVEKIYLGVTHTDVLETRQAIKEAYDKGALLFNYVGHATIPWWAAEVLFSTQVVPQLQNDNRTPIVLAMTCLDGYFHAAGYDSLSEAEVRAAHKGAVAAWAATGLGVAHGHDYLHRGFYRAVFQQGTRVLGEATLVGKLTLYEGDAGGFFHDLLDTYGILGDPALHILMPVADVSVEARPATQITDLGDTFEVHLLVRNEGGLPARSSVVTLTLPANVKFVSAQVNGTPVTPVLQPHVAIALGTLPANTGVDVRVLLRTSANDPPPTTDLGVGIEVSTTSEDKNLTNNQASFRINLRPADLQVSLQAQVNRPVFPGSLIYFTVRYTNAGPGRSGPAYLALPLQGFSDTHFTASDDRVTRVGGDPYTWLLPPLNVGEGGTIAVTAAVSPHLSPNTPVLFVDARLSPFFADPNVSNNVSSEIRVEVIFPDAYEPDDTRAQATEFVLPACSRGHTYHYVGDQDWFRCTLNAGQVYLFYTTHLGDEGNTILTLYDSDGRVLVKNDDAVPGEPWSLLRWRPARSGVYYLRVSGWDDAPYGWHYDLCGAQAIGRSVPFVAARYVAPYMTPTPTPTLTPTPTWTPTPTLTPTPTPTPTRTPTPTPTPTRTPTPTWTLTWTPTLTPTSSPTPTLAPTPTPTFSPTPYPTGAACPPRYVGRVYVGEHPINLAAWGDKVYVSLVDTADLAVVDTRSLVREAIWDSPGMGANAVFADARRVYLVHRDSRQVAVFDRTSGRLLDLWPTDVLPWGIVGMDGHLYVSNYGSDTVLVFDANTGDLLRRVLVGDKPALLTRMGHSVYVPLVGDEMVRLSRGGQEVVYITRVGAGTVFAAPDEDAGVVYVSNRDQHMIVVVSDVEGRVRGYIGLPGSPVGLALSPNRHWLYAVDPFANTLHIIDVRRNRWVASIPIGDQGGAHGGQGILIVGDRMYITDYGSGTLSIYTLPSCALH